MSLMDSYMEYYKPLLSKFCNNLTEKLPRESYCGIPHPFIPAWGNRYEQSLLKLAIIGLETRGWNPPLPEYIKDVQEGRWESSFDISDFQNLDFIGWTEGPVTRFKFWGFVMYLLAALYGVKNWEVLKRKEHSNILNCFVWGNATAIERWESKGIPDGTDQNAWLIAREAAHELNDFQHIQRLFSPDVSIVMCERDVCDFYLRNTQKKVLWINNDVRFMQAGNRFIFNTPHPLGMMFSGRGADFYAETIRTGLLEQGLFHPMQEFIDLDKETEAILHTFFSQCKKFASNTREAVAFIATELRKQDAKMTVRMLCQILNQLGFSTTYGTEYKGGRGSYKMVSGAWHYYHNVLKKQDVAESIAQAFTKPNGDYAYWDY